MKLLLFLGRYVRRYWRWALVALAATAVYAVATVLIIQLLEPVFTDVLQLGTGEMPAGIGALFPAREGGAGGEAAGGVAAPLPKPRIFLDRFLHDGYEGLKARLGVSPSQLVLFVPLLFVTIFMLRSFSDFVNGYAFQQLAANPQAIPAREITLGETPRRTNQLAVRAKTRQPRAAIGRRSVGW